MKIDGLDSTALDALLAAHPGLPGDVASTLTRIRDAVARREAEEVRKAEILGEIARLAAQMADIQAAARDLDRRYYAIVDANGWRGGESADLYLRTEDDRRVKDERDRLKGEVSTLEYRIRDLKRRVG